MSPLLLPVGHRVGTVVGADSPGRHHGVRRARQVFPLTDDEFCVWLLAHGRADGAEVTPATDAGLRAAAAGLGVADPGPTLAELCGVGLVVAVDPDPAAARRFATRHRLRPLLWGLGNSAGAPGAFRLGFPGIPLIEVTAAVYDVWSRAGAATSLWQACAGTAGAIGKGTAAARTDRLTAELLGQLPGLFAVAAAYLDAVPDADDVGNDGP